MGVETLKPELIVQTIEMLHQRIGERFPESGLNNVCHQLSLIAQNMQARSQWIGKPVMWLRYVTWSICLVLVLFALVPFVIVATSEQGFKFADQTRVSDVIQIMEAGINDVVLIGAAIFFLLTFETRYKRQRALKALHELRSIAHVIDMHQLTKDPHRIAGKQEYQNTEKSPKLKMTRFELHRYLDYCSEMLSLASKIAAVYVQEFDDGVAMASASELETLTTGLSGKIWQKIAMLDSVNEQNANPTPSKSS